MSIVEGKVNMRDINVINQSSGTCGQASALQGAKSVPAPLVPTGMCCKATLEMSWKIHLLVKISTKNI